MSILSSAAARSAQHAARSSRWFILMPLLTALILGGLVWLAGADRAVGQTMFRARVPINVYDRQSIGQAFTVPADHLHRIDLMFVSYRQIREGNARLSVYDEAGARLVSQTIETSDVRDTWFSIELPIQSGVTGQTLRLELRRDADWRSPIGVRVGPGRAYPDGYGLLRGQRDDSFDLAFRAYLATPPTLPARWARVAELSETLAVGRPGLFGQPAFLLALGVAYAAGLAALVCLAAGYRRR